MIETVLSALFALICGSYAYTCFSNWRLFDLISVLKNNHLVHIEERLGKLEATVNGKGK